MSDPAADSLPAGPGAPARPSSNKGLPDTPLVLLVDDDEPKRYLIERTLRRGGYAVREAATGGAALALATGDGGGRKPDLVILDVHLPDLDGMEVCRRLKADPATARIPVLHLSTVYVGSDDRTRGLEGGADGYLNQNAEPPELLATVRALLRTRAAEEGRPRRRPRLAGHLRRHPRRHRPAGRGRHGPPLQRRPRPGAGAPRRRPDRLPPCGTFSPPPTPPKAAAATRSRSASPTR